MGTGTPLRKGNVVEQKDLDMQGLNLGEKDEDVVDEPPPKMSIAREKVLEEAKKALEEEQKSGKKGVSLVVIGQFFFSLQLSFLPFRAELTSNVHEQDTWTLENRR